MILISLLIQATQWTTSIHTKEQLKTNFLHIKIIANSFQQSNEYKEICLPDDQQHWKTEQHQRINKINDKTVELLENLSLIQ